MIPVSLTIKGFYSYQEKQTIDFTTLTDAHLFGIFGPVGSGKSSILEAISYALYGESERLNKTQDNRNYNLMNLKSNEMYIDFTFQVGTPPTEYRFVVSGKRHKKYFDNVGSHERKAYKKNELGQWEPVDASSAEEIIGLSYENFRRTIILPQNRFQEFLQLKSSERTKMLREIFNLGKFELYPKVSTLYTKNNLDMASIDGELSGLEEITTELLQDMIRRSNAGREEVGQLTQKQDVLSKKLNKLENARKVSLEFEQQQLVFRQLEEQEKDFAQRERVLKDYELCQHNFKDHIQRVNELEAGLDELENQVKVLESQIQEITKGITSKKETQKKLQEQYKDQKGIEVHISDLKQILIIKKLKEDLCDLQKEHQAKLQKDAEQEQKIKALTSEREKVSKQIKGLKNQSGNISELNEVKNWHLQRKAVSGAIEQLVKQKNDVKQHIENLVKDRKEIVKRNDLEKLGKNLLTFKTNKLIPVLESLKEELEREERKLEKRKNDLITWQRLTAEIENLNEGEPCPLCGSPHHPHKIEPRNITSEIQDITQKILEKKGFVQRIDNAQTELYGLRKNYGVYLEQDRQIGSQVEEKRIEASKLEKQFKWQSYQNLREQDIDALIEKEMQRTKKVNDLQKTSDEQETVLIREYGIRDEIKQHLKETEVKLEGLNSKIKSHLEQIQHLKTEDYQSTDIDDIANEAAQAEQNLQIFREVATGIEQLESETKELSIKKASKIEQFENQKKAVAKQQAELNAKLNNSSFDSISDVIRILDQDIDIEQERKAIGTFREKFIEARAALKKLTEQLQKEQFDPEEYQKQKTASEELAKVVDTKKSEVAVLDNRINDFRKKLEQKKQLEETRSKLQNRSDNLNLLKKLFKSSGFVSYVSSVYLQNLCDLANERFHKLTRQQLRLEVSPSNSFEVRDFLNDGKTRNIKTLSGGQTFQAALSLALALAENTQALTKSDQNFFFLDEGFGTLDRDSLQLVFEALKSLRQENRIVGIISHIEELQQEIDVHLRIKNDVERGSLVVRSWE